MTLAVVPETELTEHVEGESGATAAIASPSVVLGERFQSALAYAYELHADQRRKGSAPQTPYLGHILGVCSIVIDDGGSEDEAIAALLHDTVEDAGGAEVLRTIRKQFGKQVARIIEICSDTHEDPKPPWEERKKAFITRIASRQTPPGALRVIAADKLHNVRSLLDDYRRAGDELWNRFETAPPEISSGTTGR